MIDWLYNTIGWNSADPEVEAATDKLRNVLHTYIIKNKYQAKRAAVLKIQSQYRLYLIHKQLELLRQKRRNYRKYRPSIPQTENEYQDKVRLLMKTRSYLYRDIESIDRILKNSQETQKIKVQ